MKRISFLIKPASSLCNLRCRYCFYNDISEIRQQKSYGIMQESVASYLIQRAIDESDYDAEITFAFQGGEPTLAGLSFYKQFCAEVKRVKKDTQKVNYLIQTNGILIDEEWAAFFKQEKFLVGVSLDGYETNTNYFRYDDKKQGAYFKIMQGIRILKKYEVDFNILTVLTHQLSKHPKALYEFYKKHHFSYVQLIPCLPSLQQNKKQDEDSLRPHDFASFYKDFYELWLKDYQKGNYMSVTLFDNVIPMFADLPPQQCGMLGFCSPQLVVEADGSIYPCDFYVMDHYRCGNIVDNTISEIIKNECMVRFLHEEKRMNVECQNCPFYSICRGGCKRQNVVYFEDNSSYCGYRDFLTYAYASMIRIARTLK